jgi:hypothetical protein
MSTTLFPASAISLSCLSSSGADGRLAFFVAKIILQHAAKKEAADRGKINLHEAWELDQLDQGAWRLEK